MKKFVFAVAMLLAVVPVMYGKKVSNARGGARWTRRTRAVATPLTPAQTVKNAARSMRKPADSNVDPIFVERWSPRAMSGKPVSEAELMTLFEAARWAPSSYNGQPWRLLYAHKGTEAWNKLLSVLVPFNQTWVKNAGVLMLIVSRNTFDHNNAPSRTHSFDTGAAWANMALQGSVMGLVVHGMSGFDFDKAREIFAIPEGYTIEAMAAVGKPAPSTVLPEQMRGMEKPSDRKPVESFAFNGEFKA